YRPETGRFLSADPTDGFSWRPISQHKYLYGEGDPVNKSDPSGLAALADAAVLQSKSPDLVLTFLTAGTTLVATCTASAACRFEVKEHRGKIQAQGKDFKDPGVGLSFTWDLPWALP